MIPEDLSRTQHLHEQAVEAVHREHEAFGHKPSRRETVRLVAVGAIVAVAFGTGFNTLVSCGAAQDVAILAAQEETRAENRRQDRQLAEDAYKEAQRANQALKRRGEDPVKVPAPGEATSADVIANAAVPVVIEKLSSLGISADGIAASVAQYIRTHPQGPSVQTLAALIAEHYRLNPPAPGKDGAKGDPGPAPTAEQIIAAVEGHCAAQPGGSCEGAKGDKGDKGDQGDPGPLCSTGFSRQVIEDWDHDNNPLTDLITVEWCVED